MGERIGAHIMNNMGKKRIQANFIVVLVLILILAACEGKNAGSGPQGSKSSAVSVQTEVEGKQPAEPAEEAEGAVEPAAEPGGEQEGAAGSAPDAVPGQDADAVEENPAGSAPDAGQNADGLEEGAAGSAADVSQEADVKEGTDAQSADIASGDSYSVAAADEDQGLVLDSKAAPAAEPPVREPAITKQPAEAVVKEGGTAVFKVSAEGDGLKYRWQARKPGDEKWRNTEAGDGLETPVLTVPNVNTGRNRFRYRCRITDEHGKTIYTDGVFLYVLGIRSSPKNQNVKADHTATFRISAVGKDLKYKWEYKRSSEGDWKKSSEEGCETAVLKVSNTPAGHNGYRYRCRISDAAGNKIYSKAAVLYILGIRTDPSTQYVKQGGTAVFKVKASGKGLKYRWQVRLPEKTEWQNCGGEGVETPVLTLYDLSGGKNNRLYRCRVSDADGKVTYSKGARLYVLSIQSNPSSQNVREKQTGSFWVAASGGGIRYQWQVRETGNSSWRNSSSSGHATRNLRVSGRTAYNGYQFRCKVSDKKGNAVYSKAVSFHVFGIRSSPKNQNVRAGNKAVFRVSATGAGLKYQWQVRDNSGWRRSGSPGHTTSTLRVTTKTAHNGFAFRCKVTDSKGRSAYTNAAKLYVFGIRSQPSDVLTYSGETAVFRVRASGAGLKYRWQVKEYANGGWRNSASTGHTSNTLKVRAALGRDGFQFRCKVYDSAGHSAYTRTAYMWVDP